MSDHDESYTEREVHRVLRRLEEFCFGNGKPPLEKRIMAEVVQMMTHQKNSYRQGDADIWAAIKDEDAARQHQHEQNLSMLKWIIGLLLSGTCLALTAFGLLIAVLKR